jgi:hypothetical protein
MQGFLRPGYKLPEEGKQLEFIKGRASNRALRN